MSPRRHGQGVPDVAHGHAEPLQRRRRRDGSTWSRRRRSSSARRRTWSTFARRAPRSEHSIAALIGKSPAEFSHRAADKFDPHVPGVPPGPALDAARAPSRRRERRSATWRRRMRASASRWRRTSRRSDLYGQHRPGRKQSTSNLLKAPFRVWAWAPTSRARSSISVRAPRRSTSARAAYDEQVANYRQTVIARVSRKSRTTSPTCTGSPRKRRSQHEAVRAARESVVLTVNQYKAGTVSYLNVVTVQATQLNEEAQARDAAGPPALGDRRTSCAPWAAHGSKRPFRLGSDAPKNARTSRASLRSPRSRRSSIATIRRRAWAMPRRRSRIGFTSFRPIRESEVGPDGHALKGSFLPPVALAAAHVGGKPPRIPAAARAGLGDPQALDDPRREREGRPQRQASSSSRCATR